MKQKINGEQSYIPWKNTEQSTFLNFFCSRQLDVVPVLKNLNAAPQGLYYIWSQPACGKTHLLQSCFHYLTQQNKSVLFLSFSDAIGHQIDLIEHINAFEVLIIDDVDHIKGRAAELAMLDLLNSRIDVTKQQVVCSATHSPTQVRFLFNDLRTRLASGFVYHIEPPSMICREKIVRKWLDGDGFVVDQRTLNYLIGQCGHSMEVLRQAVYFSKKKSMAHQKKITIPMIREILKLKKAG